MKKVKILKNGLEISNKDLKVVLENGKTNIYKLNKFSNAYLKVHSI